MARQYPSIPQYKNRRTLRPSRRFQGFLTWVGLWLAWIGREFQSLRRQFNEWDFLPPTAPSYSQRLQPQVVAERTAYHEIQASLDSIYPEPIRGLFQDARDEAQMPLVDPRRLRNGMTGGYQSFETPPTYGLHAPRPTRPSSVERSSHGFRPFNSRQVLQMLREVPLETPHWESPLDCAASRPSPRKIRLGELAHQNQSLNDHLNNLVADYFSDEASV